MDAVEFIEERNRMCDQYWRVDGDCDGCPLVYTRECNEIRNMVDDSGKSVGKVVEIVEKWSKEHPRKTRQDVFLCQWPETALVDGIIGIKPCSLVAAFRLGQECHKTFCYDCSRKFWMQEVK